MSYLALKHMHLTFVVLSIAFFVIRFIWSQIGSSLLDKKLVKVLPHVIDTLLLLSAAALCVTLSQYPFATGWVTAKLVGVVAYIGFGLFALKLGKTKSIRWAAFAGAILSLGFTAHVAVSKQALFF